MPKARPEPLEIDLTRFLRVFCKACYSEFVLQGQEPARDEMRAGHDYMWQFCVYCGARAPFLEVTPTRYPKTSNWMDIAVSRGMPATPLSEELIKALYELWDPYSPGSTDPKWFAEFLDLHLNEDQDGSLEPNA